MFKKKYIKWNLFAGLFVFVSAASHAQDSLNTVDNVIITVETEGTVQLKDAVKIDYNPQIDPPKLTPPTLTYTIEDKQYKTNPEIVPAKPQSYNSKENEKLYGNYTKIGYGSYNMPLLETYFYNTQSKTMDYGIRYNYLSGEYKPRNQVFNDNMANGHFTYHLSPLSKVNIHSSFERHRINWYGFDPDSSDVGIDSTKNIYNNFGIGSYFEKAGRSKDDYSFGAGADYFFQNDKYGNKENYFVARGEVKKMTRKHPLTVPLSIATTTFGKDNATYTRLFVDLNPRWYLDYSRMILNVGFNSTLFHDSVGGKFYFYPCAEFTVKIIENKLNAHIGIEGGVQQNTYASLLKINPFLDTVIQVHHSNTKNKVFAGIWGSIGSRAAFGIEADFGNYMNVPFFLCDTTVIRKYKVVYDNVDIFNVKGTLQLQWAEKFKSTLEFSYHNYTQTES